METRILKKWDPILKKDELEGQSGVVRRICQWQFSDVWVQSERNWKRKIKSCVVWNSKLKVEVHFRVELWSVMGNGSGQWLDADESPKQLPLLIVECTVKRIIHYSFLKEIDPS